MPCYDGRGAEDNARDAALYNETAKKKVQLELDLEEAKTEIKLKNAMLCAVISEISRTLNTDLDAGEVTINELLIDASMNGSCPGILDFWEEHKKEDVSKLVGIIDMLSQHEKEMLKALLNKTLASKP